MKQIGLIISFSFLVLAGFSQKAVDLGLSVKWTTCNVGAKNPGEYGSYLTFEEAQEQGRVPTKAEFDELRNNCSWEWTQMYGVNGYKVTAKNGNFIFLPAAGDRNGSDVYNVGSCGYYWSSSAVSSDRAGYLYFYSDNAYMYYDYRYVSRSVRLVRGL